MPEYLCFPQRSIQNILQFWTRTILWPICGIKLEQKLPLHPRPSWKPPIRSSQEKKRQLQESSLDSNPEGDLIELIKAFWFNEKEKIVANNILREKNNKKLQNSELLRFFTDNLNRDLVDRGVRKTELDL